MFMIPSHHNLNNQNLLKHYFLTNSVLTYHRLEESTVREHYCPFCWQYIITTKILWMLACEWSIGILCSIYRPSAASGNRHVSRMCLHVQSHQQTHPLTHNIICCFWKQYWYWLHRGRHLDLTQGDVVFYMCVWVWVWVFACEQKEIEVSSRWVCVCKREQKHKKMRDDTVKYTDI